MSDNEYERFEITDYDLDNEFNPNRPRRRFTKHQQIYGIWADDSDNEVEESTSRRHRGGGRKAKDYSAPVSFVSGGVQQAGKKSEEKVEDDSQITDEEDERPSLGGAAESNTSTESEEDSRPQRTGLGSSRNAQSRSAGPANRLAAWEKHTKGIGAKLLLQMGYEPGKGLGKDLQGISQPVQAHMRKGRGAIGAYGPEKPPTLDNQNDQIAIEEEQKPPKESREKVQMWRKDGKPDKSKRSRYYYKSVQEIIEKGKKSSMFADKIGNKLSNVTVIDMTGPEKRVLSGYHALGQAKVQDEDIYEHQHAKKCTNFTLPELMHNLNLIVDMCEQQIIAIDKTERDAHEKYKQLEQEQENLDKIVELENAHIKTIKKALELVEILTSGDETLTLEKAENIFIDLQTDFAAEYKEFGLGDLAGGVIAPLLNTELENWKPLEEPTRHVDKVKKWRTILGITRASRRKTYIEKLIEKFSDMHQSETRSVFDPYSALIWGGVVPSLRAAAAGWNPKVHQQMAALLDTWAPLLPTWILDNVLEQVILPRLHWGVQNWDPLTDTIPIHVWILPWNGILGHKMEEFIYPTIREKLGSALLAWTPQDRSARAMLTPWKNAFGDGELHSFLLKHIIPKLQVTLTEMIINPLQQDLEPWNQVWEWHEVIPTALMTQLLDKFFFPKWMQTLVIWLNQSPNLDQISRWYTGWKSLFTDEMLEQTSIKEHFRRALELMQRATAAITVPVTPAPEPPPPPQVVPSALIHPPALMDLQILPPPQLEFKELVSQKCSERGIIFAPMPGRREFGKQVYRVGKMFCYIDRTVLMVSDGSFSNWAPTSLGLMLERSVTGMQT